MNRIKLTFFLLSLFLLFNTIFAQKSPFFVAYNNLKDSGYFSAIQFLIENDTTYKNTSMSSSYFQALSTYYSFVGNHKLAINSFDKMYFSNPDTVKIKEVKTVDLPENMVFINAIDYIEKIAANYQIIIINEAHYISQHRLLTKELLPILKKQGFEYLSIEALSYLDSNRTTQFPTTESGFYIIEPIFGNLVRDAVKLEYKIFSHEKPIDCQNSDEQKFYCNNLREITQAIEIKKILDKFPSAKIIVHVGHAHLEESTTNDWVKMAEYLKLLTGINPLTINQTDYRERSSIVSNDLYESIVKKSNITGPFVCLVNDSVWNPKKDKFDIPVIWSKSIYKNNRPDYLSFQKKTFEHKIPKNQLFNNTIVQAFLENETKNAIPVDQTIVRNKKEEYSLFLRTNSKYIINIKDRNNKLISSYNITN